MAFFEEKRIFVLKFLKDHNLKNSNILFLNDSNPKGQNIYLLSMNFGVQFL